MQTYNRDASDEAAAPVVSFTDANFSRRGGDVLFRNLTWTVREGETWAVVGPVGAGKTTLAEVLLGRHRLDAGSLAWPLLDRLRGAGRAVTFPAEILKRVSFRDAAGPFDFSRHYYQQRFNFVEPHDDLRVEAFLRSGNQATDADVDAVVERLGLEALRTLSLIQLSSGQNRRARIARALLARPEWLLLDEPFLGLDVAGRSEVADLLGELHPAAASASCSSQFEARPSELGDARPRVGPIGRALAGDTSGLRRPRGAGCGIRGF